MKVVVETENISKSFGDKHILKGVSLTVAEGENVVILGRSGTGKSVFIKCIVGLVEPDEGSIKVLGKDVLNINRNDMNDIRRDIGFLFQGAALYDSMSVRENLAFPLRTVKMSKDEVEAQVKEALDNVGLADAIDKMPAELSGGMRKRVGLARAIIMKPKI
ncbi:MAG TPA: ATP-binding cassette domain-containing protein, partial [Bacteroidia bacterium]|nr:ATP-binding cassette domain-containing protein [Bacteroidia bacterium]